MKKINDEFEFEIKLEDISDLIESLQIEHDGIKLDKIYEIAPTEGKQGYYYDVIMGNSQTPGRGVIYNVIVSPEVFKIYGKNNEDDHIDLSYMWRKLLLSKRAEEYANYFLYNWEEIENEYTEDIIIAEQYLEHVKATYEDVLATYQEAMQTIENMNNKKR